MSRGGNYWTLFTLGIWKVLHAVLHVMTLPPVGISCVRTLILPVRLTALGILYIEICVIRSARHFDRIQTIVKNSVLGLSADLTRMVYAQVSSHSWCATRRILSVADG